MTELSQDNRGGLDIAECEISSGSVTVRVMGVDPKFLRSGRLSDEKHADSGGLTIFNDLRSPARSSTKSSPAFINETE